MDVANAASDNALRECGCLMRVASNVQAVSYPAVQVASSVDEELACKRLWVGLACLRRAGMLSAYATCSVSASAFGRAAPASKGRIASGTGLRACECG